MSSEFAYELHLFDDENEDIAFKIYNFVVGTLAYRAFNREIQAAIVKKAILYEYIDDEGPLEFAEYYRSEEIKNQIDIVVSYMDKI